MADCFKIPIGAFGLLLVLLSSSARAQLPPPVTESGLFPYGMENGDSNITVGDDISSPPIELDRGMIFMGKRHTIIYVNDNGVLSFDNVVNDHSEPQETFPVGQIPPTVPGEVPRQMILIAPFYANVDIMESGQIFYRQSTDQDLMDRCDRAVHQYFIEKMPFKTEFMIIATWVNVSFHGYQGGADPPVNTFQVVLAADEFDTFAFFRYETIQWTTGTESGGNSNTGMGGNAAIMGFNAGDNINYNIEYLYSGQSQELRKLPQNTNNDETGMFVYHITHNAVNFPKCRHEVKCGTLFPPDQGTMEVVVNNDVITATFTCDEGYKLQGTPTRKCEANGKWTGVEATCVAITMPKPSSTREVFTRPNPSVKHIKREVFSEPNWPSVAHTTHMTHTTYPTKHTTHEVFSEPNWPSVAHTEHNTHTTYPTKHITHETFSEPNWPSVSHTEHNTHTAYQKPHTTAEKSVGDDNRVVIIVCSVIGAIILGTLLAAGVYFLLVNRSSTPHSFTIPQPEDAPDQPGDSIALGEPRYMESGEARYTGTGEQNYVEPDWTDAVNAVEALDLKDIVGVFEKKEKAEDEESSTSDSDSESIR